MAAHTIYKTGITLRYSYSMGSRHMSKKIKSNSGFLKLKYMTEKHIPTSTRFLMIGLEIIFKSKNENAKYPVKKAVSMKNFH